MLLLAPRCKGSRIARIVWNGNTKPHAEMYVVYMNPFICTCLNRQVQKGLSCLHTSRRTFAVALFLTLRLEFARFLHRQSQSVSKRLLVCASHFFVGSENSFSAWDVAKVGKFSEEPKEIADFFCLLCHNSMF